MNRRVRQTIIQIPKRINPNAITERKLNSAIQTFLLMTRIVHGGQDFF